MKPVTTSQGLVVGVELERVDEFRGIPFAAPPTAERRFMAPGPAPSWSGVLEAHRFRDAAWQQPNPLMGTERISDDCLYLNLWRPKGEGPFPVMVWIHGGAYTSGSPSQLLYSGRELAASQGVIVVNLSYRLGAWGYGWFDQVAPALAQAGNRGLQDQVAGLRWIQANIAAFGGDPGQVTVFGESAGGFSVASLMACPQAAGLFQRAIVQSGAGDFVLAPDQASQVAQTVVDHLPGSGSAESRLMTCQPEEMIRAQFQAARQVVLRGCRETTPQFGMTFMPVVDGDWLPDVPVNRIAAGEAKDIALLAGVCRDEWHLFQYAPPFNGGVGLDRLRQLDMANIEKRFARNLPHHASRALDAYRASVDVHPQRGLLDYCSALETDRTFVVPTLRMLDAQVAAGGEAWGFRFDWEIDAFGVPLGACHVMDVPFVFGLTQTPAGKVFTGGGEGAQRLSDQVMQAWGRFAHGQSPGWSSWQQGRTARVFGGEGSQVGLLTAGMEDLWASIIGVPERRS